MQTVTTRFNAQRAARRALGSPAAQEGVHFTTTKTAGGWTWAGIPGDALNALSETVRRAATGHHVEVADGIPDVVPAFLRRDFEGSAERVAAQAARHPKTEKPETGTNGKRQPKPETIEKPAKPSKKEGAKAAQIRKLRETAAGMRATSSKASDGAGGDVPPVKARKTNAPKMPGVNKSALVASLLQRPDGATLAELLDATGWPAMSVPRQAELAKLDLRKEKEAGKPTRYYGTPKASA